MEWNKWYAGSITGGLFTVLLTLIPGVTTWWPAIIAGTATILWTLIVWRPWQRDSGRQETSLEGTEKWRWRQSKEFIKRTPIKLDEERIRFHALVVFAEHRRLGYIDPGSVRREAVRRWKEEVGIKDDDNESLRHQESTDKPS